MIHAGRHFLQIPGPTNVPERILQAMNRSVIDHRGPEFAKLAKEVLENVKLVFRTRGPVVIYPASGSGGWEASIVNTLSPGDHVVMFETGHFSQLWRQVAERFGLQVNYLPGNWRSGANPRDLEVRLESDRQHQIKAVMVVHNETSTGATSSIADVRRVLNQAKHPALLMVDSISSLASIDYRHDEWEVDVTIAGSQKGLMLPPGLGMNAISERALAASKQAKMPRSYWNWQDMLQQPGRFLPVHSGHNPALWTARSADHAARGRVAQCISPAYPSRRSHTCGGESLGTGNCLREPQGILEFHDCGVHAAGPQRGRTAQGHSGEL
jgi:alanine-glyoxylate transaminase/serine-glyoxylate transaminase/serine-pyruvate transaminase